jgi:hypothetical protein
MYRPFIIDQLTLKRLRMEINVINNYDV